MIEKTLITVVGPTAIGKTSLGIALAKQFKTVIISADSRQFYKEMQIGTAAPSLQERTEAIHHCVQHISIHDYYTVGDFEKEALQLLDELFKTHETVIMVGGSGLYIDAVTKGLNEFPMISPDIRTTLNEKFETKGISYLQEKLEQLDPEYYDTVDRQNPHRLIRALEVCLGTEKPYSTFINQPKKQRPFKTISVGLTAERDVIYNRINKRVDLMMEAGLIDEVSRLQPYKNLNALQTVGYRELFPYLEGHTTLAIAVEEIKKNTRRFAKRQLTWFKKNKDTLWFDYEMPLQKILCTLEKEFK